MVVKRVFITALVICMKTVSCPLCQGAATVVIVFNCKCNINIKVGVVVYVGRSLVVFVPTLIGIFEAKGWETAFFME